MSKITKQKFDSRTDWLELRKSSIGGSDAAALVGLNAYSSPLAVYLDKIGEAEPKPVTEAMRQGTELEDYVARRFSEETGKKVHKAECLYKNSDYPYAHATIDRKVTGENAGLECKTTSVLNLKKFDSGEFPENYYIQCLHYMAVCGFDRYYLAVLILNKDFKVFTIERTPEVQEEIDALMRIEEDFYTEYVLTGTPPPPDGSVSSKEVLELLYPDSEPTTVDLTPLSGKVKKLFALKKNKKELEGRIETLKQEISSYLAEAERGQTTDYKVSWKTTSRRNFDLKRFRADHPEIDLEDYYNERTSRVFTIKEQ